jgi:uncharacterized protein YraI
LGEPGLKLEEVFKKTAQQVAARTANKQKPWINTSITGDFYFNEAVAPATAEKAGPPQSAHQIYDTVTKDTKTKQDMLLWETVKDSDDTTMFEAYLAQFPKGTFAAIAHIKLKNLQKSKSTKKAKIAALTKKDTLEVEELDEHMWVDANSLSVRKGPGTSHERIRNVVRGDKVEVTGKVKGRSWYRIALQGGGDGYLFGKYLNPNSPQPETQIARRSTPSSEPTPREPVNTFWPTDRIQVAIAGGGRFSSSFRQLLKDIVFQGFDKSEWTKMDRISVRLSDVGYRKENNADYAGAKFVEGIFGAFLGTSIPLASGVSPTVSVYNARATIIAQMKDGTSWTDAASFEKKGDPAKDHKKALLTAIMTATRRATERVAIRVSGGVPPLKMSDITADEERERTEAERMMENQNN